MQVLLIGCPSAETSASLGWCLCSPGVCMQRLGTAWGRAAEPCSAREPVSIRRLLCHALPGIAIWLHSRLHHLRCCTLSCGAQSITTDKAAKAVAAEDPPYRKLAPHIAELFLACNYFIKFRRGILLQHPGKAVGSWRGECDFWDSEALFHSVVTFPALVHF